MNAQMYDVQYVAARLAARRVPAGQVGQAQEKPMTKRHSLTEEERAELRELIAGDADEEALGAFAQRYNVHGNSMRGFILSIRRQLAAGAMDAEMEPAADEPPALAVQPPALVITPPHPAGPGRAQRAGQRAAGGADRDCY